MSKVSPHGKIPQRNITFSDDQWDALGAAATELKVSRSSLVRNLIALAWQHTMSDTHFDPRLPAERSPFQK